MHCSEGKYINTKSCVIIFSKKGRNTEEVWEREREREVKLLFQSIVWLLHQSIMTECGIDARPQSFRIETIDDWTIKYKQLVAWVYGSSIRVFVFGERIEIYLCVTWKFCCCWDVEGMVTKINSTLLGAFQYTPRESGAMTLSMRLKRVV